MNASLQDTIAAIATPPGLGGIAILRISGTKAADVLGRLFIPAKSTAVPFAFQPRHMHYGYALDKDGQRLDEVLAVFMPGPHSATGEDVGEVHCHGGTGITSALLEAALVSGARLAGPGEFTRRAFLHGRMDLTQAEAVAEMISAPTRQGVRLAGAKLEGVLARTIQSMRAALDALRIQVTLAVDFPEEDAELLPRAAFAGTVQQALHDIRELLAGFDRARLWREGVVAVLAGRVNAGKSSLLNALLGRARAIVSNEPGTTRDYIEESIHLHGMPLRLIDTAGLREGGGMVEAEGMRRSRDLAAEADILLLVMDTAQGPGPEEWDFLRLHNDKATAGRILLVLNKADASTASNTAALQSVLAEKAPTPALAERVCSCPCFAVSAREGSGLAALADGLHTAVLGLSASPATSAGSGPVSSPQDVLGDLAPNLRQSHLLRQAEAELAALEQGLTAQHPPDILGVHLDAAVLLLDEVTGSTTNDELLDRIFATFCIGK